MNKEDLNFERIRKGGKFLKTAFYLGLAGNLSVVILMIIAYIRPEIYIKMECLYLSSVAGVTGNILMLSQLYFAGKNLVLSSETE
jgi:hypothetical protein